MTNQTIIFMVTDSINDTISMSVDCLPNTIFVCDNRLLYDVYDANIVVDCIDDSLDLWS
jgi:hypothetical protein